MYKKLIVVFSLFFLVFSSASIAHHVSDHKVDAIVLSKGHARIIISVSGSSIEAELYTPMVNVLGFVGKPSNDVEQAEFDAASTWFSQASNVFTFAEAAQCVAIVAEVNTSNIDGQAKADNAKLAEFDVYYVWECKNSAALNQIEVNLFEQYPAHKEIFSKRQGVGEIKRDKLVATKNSIGLK